MKLHTLLYDFVDIIGNFPTMEAIKLVPAANGLHFYGKSSASNKVGMFVLEGQTIEPVDGVKSQFGIPDLGQVAKIFKAPGFNRLNASVELEKLAFASEFEQLVFSSHDGSTYKLSAYGANLSDDRIKLAKLKAQVNYQVSTTPTKDALSVTKYWLKVSRENGASAVELTPITRGGGLFFKTTAAPIFNVEYPVDSCVGGLLTQVRRYDCRVLYSLMSLAPEAKQSTLMFSDSGLCRFDVETSCAKYTFLIPSY